MPEVFNFGEALDHLKAGLSVCRDGWNGKGQKLTLPYIYIQTVQGDLVPWLASQTDLLAEDWLIA